MAKAQTTAATNIAKGASTNVGPDVQPVIDTATGQQQTNINRADQTYGTAQQGYQNFAKTGGFSPQDETTYLNRATQGVSGTYDVLAKQAERQRMAAGGLGTGGEISQMARQGTQQQANATENAQADLKQMENANKLAGLAGTTALFDTTTNQITAQGAQILQALGLKYNTQAEAATILAKLSTNPGILSNIMSIGGMVGGGLTGLAGALDKPTLDPTIAT